MNRVSNKFNSTRVFQLMSSGVDNAIAGCGGCSGCGGCMDLPD